MLQAIAFGERTLYFLVVRLFCESIIAFLFHF